MDFLTAIYFVAIVIEMVIRAPLNQKRSKEKISERRYTRQEKILLVQGSAFHWDAPDHLRIAFLPRVDDLSHAIERLGSFLERYTG